MTYDLHRHQLVRLSPCAWAGVLAHPWDAQARGILAHWHAHGLPLVVARQSHEHAAAGLIALGLPAPARWQRRRMGLTVESSGLDGAREFPAIDEVFALAASQAALQVMRQLHQGLSEAGVQAFVFGSHGWQSITGLEYLRPGSDLDLWVSVGHIAQADQLAALLRALPQAPLRVDAEFVFPCGSAVAWREWDAWRAGRTRAVLVKGWFDVALREDAAWCEGAAA